MGEIAGEFRRAGEQVEVEFAVVREQMEDLVEGYHKLHRAQQKEIEDLQRRVADLEGSPPEPPPNWSTQPGEFPFHSAHSPTYAQLEVGQNAGSRAYAIFASPHGQFDRMHNVFESGVASLVGELNLGGYRSEVSMKHPNYLGAARMPWKGLHRISWTMQFLRYTPTPHASIHAQIHAAESGTSPNWSLQRHGDRWRVRTNRNVLRDGEWVKEKTDLDVTDTIRPHQTREMNFSLEVVQCMPGPTNPGEAPDEAFMRLRLNDELVWTDDRPNSQIVSADARDSRSYFRCGSYWSALKRMDEDAIDDLPSSQMAVMVRDYVHIIEPV